MLSSESAAAGTNLTAAKNVILLDAIYKDDTNNNTNTNTNSNGIGSYEYRRNMEWQAIGRAYRMGQTKKVSVVRFIMKDTVEEEIYKINKEEDKKFKDNVDLIDKMIEMDDEKINATNEDIEKMTKNAEEYNKTKPTIPNDQNALRGSAARAAPRGQPGGPPPATAHPARVDATGRLCTTHRPQSLVLVVLLLLGVFPVVVAAIEWVRQRQAARRKVLHVLRDGALVAGLALYHG
jgi:hypothetical protein